MNSYTLSRQWFDYAFENSSKVKPIHGSIYFWIIELANRLGWPAEFGNPGSQCMAACGISSYNTYKKAFDELVDFGFIQVNRKSTNQYQSCVIALSIIDNSPYKALDKALDKHSTKHLQGTIQSTDSINKPETIKPLNLEPLNNNAALSYNSEKEIPEPLTAKKEKEKSCAKKEKANRRPWANDLSFEDKDTPELREKWQEWIDYKFTCPKPKVTPYSTQRGEQSALNEIGKFATPFALWAIDNAIEKEWAGIVNESTYREYEKYGRNPAAFLASKGKPTLTVNKTEPVKDSPEYYAELRKKYTFSQTA